MINSEADIDNLFQTNVDRFDMTPPEKAWASLNAELDSKQAVIYKKKAYRYKLISIGLSIVLISLLSYQYFIQRGNQHLSNNKLASNDLKVISETQGNSVRKNYTNKNTSDFNQNNIKETTGSNSTISSDKNRVVSNPHRTSINGTSKSINERDNNTENISVTNQHKISTATRSNISISRPSKNTDEKYIKSKNIPISGKHDTEVVSGNNTVNPADENKVISNNDKKYSSPANAKKTNEVATTLVNNGSSAIVALNEEKGGNKVSNNNTISNYKTSAPIGKSETPLIEKANNISATTENVQANTIDAVVQNQKQPGNDSTNKSPNNISILTEKSTAGTDVQKINEVKAIQTIIAKNDSTIIKTTIFPKNKTNFDLSKLAVAAFYSPDFNCHILVDNDKNASNHHKGNYNAKDYDQREIPDFSMTSGILLKYDLTNKWSIQSGCTYSSSVRKIKPSTIYAEQGSDSQAHYLLRSSLGIAELPNSPTSIPQVGDSLDLKTNSKQVLQFINIPLIVRFQYVKNRFSYYVYSGFSANILIKEQSIVSVENPTSQTFIISNISGLRTVTCGFLFGVGAQYNFYKGFSIFTEPVFRGSITSINQNTAVTSYPCSFGLNAGLTYHF